MTRNFSARRGLTLRAVVRLLGMCVVVGVLGSTSGWAHDLGVDVTGNTTRTTGTNPRVGSVSVGVSGAFDFNDAWSLTGLLLYTRDFATRTSESSSPGSNVWLLNLGAMWIPSDHLMTMLAVVGSPPSLQSNATTVTTRLGQNVDVTVTSRNWSLGAVWNGGWASNGDSNLEHAVDVSASYNHFQVFQQLVVPGTVRGTLLTNACESGVRLDACALVNGVTTPLNQGRFTVGYTATLVHDTDVGLEAGYYLYDVDPSTVGYWSLVAFNDAELGSGVPVLPLQLTVRPSFVHRFLEGKVSLKVSYQLGVYTRGQGALHIGSARVSIKMGKHWRLGFTVTGQADVSGGQLKNSGGQGLVGLTYVW